MFFLSTRPRPGKKPEHAILPQLGTCQADWQATRPPHVKILPQCHSLPRDPTSACCSPRHTWHASINAFIQGTEVSRHEQRKLVPSMLAGPQLKNPPPPDQMSADMRTPYIYMLPYLLDSPTESFAAYQQWRRSKCMMIQRLKVSHHV